MTTSGYISPNVVPSAGEQENPVAVPSARQQALEARRELPRALMGGTDAMRAAGRKYVPQHPHESDESYAMRLQATTLYNAFAQTVGSQTGKLFTKPVTLVDGDDTMQAFAADVDGEGRTLTAFAADLTKEAFVDGIALLMVDFPTLPDGATQADAMLLGARPYFVLVRACQVLGWKSVNAGGQQVLLQLRFMEEADEQVDEFTTATVQQIRVLDLGGRYRVYRKMKDAQGKEDWLVYAEGQASWVEIPVVPVYTNRCGFFEGAPPLRELAELNAEHWASSSEQRRALTFLRFAMLALIGAQSSKTAAPVEMGPDKILNLPAGGDAKFIEHSGAGITAGATDLKDIEQRMQTVGMELRVENAGTVTATAAAIDSAESNAVLKAVAKGVEAALQTAMEIAAVFLRATAVGTAKVYDEFAEQVEGLPSDFIGYYGAGLLSRETVWDELVRRHVLDDDFDPALEAARLYEQESRMAALQGAALDLGVGAGATTQDQQSQQQGAGNGVG